MQLMQTAFLFRRRAVITRLARLRCSLPIAGLKCDTAITVFRSIRVRPAVVVLASSLNRPRFECTGIIASAAYRNGNPKYPFFEHSVFSSRSHFSHSNMSSSPLLLRLVASSVKIAERSGVIVRDIMKAGDLGIVEKTGKNDLQTEADRSVQRCILASLRKQFPGITVIGEEDEDTDSVDAKWVETSLCDEVLNHADKLPENLKTVKLEDFCWCLDMRQICVWVDPLDGTAEYTQGLLDHVTVLIGISILGKAIAGVVYQPYYNYQAGPDAQLGRTIWGIIGLGAFGFKHNAADPSKRIVVTTRSHETESVKNAIAACQPTEVQKVGGAGHKVLLLIEGKAHAYIFASPGCKKWDTCAPEAVLHAVGGKLTDMHGNLFEYHSTVKKQNTGGVLGTAKADELAWYLSKIPDDVKGSLPA